MFALPFYSISNSTERQSASPAFQGSASAPARLRRSGYATLPIGRTTQENPSVDFLGYCRSQRLLHVAKPRIHALVTLWQETITFPEPAQEKPLRGFSWDCRIAAQFCMLLTRPPWLSISWQETITFPEPVEGNISKKASSLALYTYILCSCTKKKFILE